MTTDPMNGPYAAQMNIEALAREAVEACKGTHHAVSHVAKILALVRAAALEEAARVCDSKEAAKWATVATGGPLKGFGPMDCARAIRAIAATKPESGT